MSNPELSPSKSLMSEAKRFTAVAVLFLGSLILTRGNSGGAELQQNPTHIQDKANIEKPLNSLQATYRTLNNTIKHNKEVLHHPFNFIKDGSKSEYLSITIAGKEKTTVWLDVVCNGKNELEFFNWQGGLSSNPVCRDTGTPSFEVLKPGRYSLYIEDTLRTVWAVGSSVKMQEVPTYTSGP